MKSRFVLLLGVGSLAFAGGMNASSDVITPRWGHTVTELGNGRLLVAGGENQNGLVAEIEIVDFGPDPSIGNITVSAQVVASLSSPRRRHAAVRLNDGRVLVSGGEDASGILGSAELIDPATGTGTQISLGAPRADHTATLLPNGAVLLAGGHDGVNSLASLQIFDPATNTITDGADLVEPRHRHTATLLDDSRLLLVGGRNESGALATTEYWDQATGTVTAGPVLSEARFGHTATLLRDQLAVVGGSDGNAPLAATETFWSGLNSFLPAGPLAAPREGHMAVALPNNGHLMVLGGRSPSGPVAAVELMHPNHRTFVSQSSLGPPRTEFGVAVAGPYVWAIGGKSSAGGALGSVDAVQFAVFTSDRTSYLPSSTVALQGDFWLPGEAVTITIVSSDEDPTSVVNTVADTDGRFLNTGFSTATDGGGFYIATARGAQSGRVATLELQKLIPTAFGGFSLSPAAITQTSNPVTLSIFGPLFQQPELERQGDYCRIDVGVGCLRRVFWFRYRGGGYRVRLTGTRNDTNINVVLDPIAASASRLDVALPSSVTSNIDHYFLTLQEELLYIEWSVWSGFIIANQIEERSSRDTASFGPLTVSPPDFTPPEIALAVDSSALVNGWYTGDVSIVWSVSDPESAISTSSGCADVSVVTDTAGATFTCSASSGGGTNTHSVTIKRDASPPDATLSVVDGTVGANGWYVSPVTVRTTGSDSVSAPVICTADKVQNADTTGSQFSGSCTNAANLTKAATPIVVKLDQTAPTISAAATAVANAAGWYQGDVTVGFSCTDATSGIATCPSDQTLNGEGASVASSQQIATDVAGHTSAPSNIVTVKIDRTAPLVALTGGPAPGGSYYFGQVPAAPSCSGSDTLSGLEMCSISGYATTVGTHTVLATAHDRAGHVNVQAATYKILPWSFAGFHAPIEMGDVVNTVKGGSTVPLAFEAFAGPNELVDVEAIMQPLKATQTLCGSAETNDVELVASGNTSLRYDAATGEFIYNWKTPKMAGYCYLVTVMLKDGTSRSAQFRLK